MKPQLKLIEQTHDETETNIGFQRINQDTLRLQFGEAHIELKTDGSISFNNTQSSLQLQGDSVILKNTHSEITLDEHGDVILKGKQLKQKSEQHIQLDAKQNIYLNSR